MFSVQVKPAPWNLTYLLLLPGNKGFPSSLEPGVDGNIGFSQTAFTAVSPVRTVNVQISFTAGAMWQVEQESACSGGLFM